MWNMVQLGVYAAPIGDVGVSVYSLGIGGAIASAVRSFAETRINKLQRFYMKRIEKP